MLSSCACKLHCNSSHCRSIGNMFTSLKVISVGNCFWKIFINIFDGRKCNCFRHDIQRCGHHYFCIMEQSIKALESCIFCRNCCHISWIDYCNYRLASSVAHTDFFVGVFFADNAPLIHF